MKNNSTKKAVFKVIDNGPIIRKKYHNDLHCFGDEVKSAGKENALKYIAHIGPHNGKKDYLEIVFWKDNITIPEILNFLKKYKIKVKLVK